MSQVFRGLRRKGHGTDSSQNGGLDQAQKTETWKAETEDKPKGLCDYGWVYQHRKINHRQHHDQVDRLPGGGGHQRQTLHPETTWGGRQGHRTDIHGQSRSATYSQIFYPDIYFLHVTFLLYLWNASGWDDPEKSNRATFRDILRKLKVWYKKCSFQMKPNLQEKGGEVKAVIWCMESQRVVNDALKTQAK